MTRHYPHPASDTLATGFQQQAGLDTRDSNMPDGNQRTGDTQQVRSQLLKMIMENERKRHTETKQPAAQR